MTECWLEDERRTAGPCPSCGVERPRPMVYGMPSAGDFARLQGAVVFAGCCLPQVLNRWSCGGCRASWGVVVRWP